MPQATFVQEGRSVDYTPGTDVQAGAVVVQGDLLGIANRPIAANELGALAVEGVFDFIKDTGVVFTAGQTLYWEGDVVVDTPSGTTKVIGKAVQAAGTNDTTVRIRLSQ